MYANVAVKRDISSESLQKGLKLFSQSIMVSVAMSQLGKSSLVFVERGAKVSSFYIGLPIPVTSSYIKDYCQTLELTLVTISLFSRMEHLLSAHRSRKTIAFLTAHIPDFIEPENWPPNSPDLNPVDYSIWGVFQ